MLKYSFETPEYLSCQTFTVSILIFPTINSFRCRSTYMLTKSRDANNYELIIWNDQRKISSDHLAESLGFLIDGSITRAQSTMQILAFSKALTRSYFLHCLLWNPFILKTWLILHDFLLKVNLQAELRIWNSDSLTIEDFRQPTAPHTYRFKRGTGEKSIKIGTEIQLLIGDKLRNGTASHRVCLA